MACDAWFARNRARPDVIQRTIEFDGVPVGSIATFAMGDEREISYWVASAHWGKGIATAAVRQMLVLDTFRPLHGRVAASNTRSAQVLLGAGFHRIGEDGGYAAGLGRVERELIYCLDAL